MYTFGTIDELLTNEERQWTKIDWAAFDWLQGIIYPSEEVELAPWDFDLQQGRVVARFYGKPVPRKLALRQWTWAVKALRPKVLAGSFFVIRPGDFVFLRALYEASGMDPNGKSFKEMASDLRYCLLSPEEYENFIHSLEEEK